MSRDIQFIKTEIAKSSMNIPGAGPESQREEPFPIVLPLANEEQFDEAEAALREESVRRKMVNHFFLQVFSYILSGIVGQTFVKGLEALKG